MPTVTIKNVQVSGAGFTMNIESDLTVAGAVVSFSVSVSRDEFAGWKTDNPAGTIDDLILLKVQAAYEPLTKLASKANTMMNKVLTW